MPSQCVSMKYLEVITNKTFTMLQLLQISLIFQETSFYVRNQINPFYSFQVSYPDKG